jgi:hypothetical protein
MGLAGLSGHSMVFARLPYRGEASRPWLRPVIGAAPGHVAVCAGQIEVMSIKYINALISNAIIS